MCGILGYSGRFAPELITHANRLQIHRGPDDSGEFFDAEAGIGLGHVRLSLLELSQLGHQPILATTLDEGLRAVGREPIDLIISDFRTPRGSMYTMCRSSGR